MEDVCVNALCQIIIFCRFYGNLSFLNNPKVGMTIDDYIVLADIPKILLESEEELPGLRWRNQSPSPCRGQEVMTHRLVEQCKYCICCFALVRVSLVQNYEFPCSTKAQ